MTRYPRRLWLLATCLSALAGYVDALGFLQLGGYFLSFMSGNSTRLAVGLAERSHAALLPAGLIATFVAGAALGALVGGACRRHRKASVLAFVTLILTGAALGAEAGLGGPAVALMALAMGALNAVFQRGGEVSVGVTYMTGALVKLGQQLAAALTGGARWGWIPHALLWGGLMTGAVAGAALHPLIGMRALWLAVAGTGLLALVAMRIGTIADEA